MDFEDFKEQEGDFIPGIFNYCDAWCERCIYTDKCRVFATQAKIREELESNQKTEKSIEENKDFWKQINDSVANIADLVDEEFPLVKGLETLFSDQFYDEEDTEDAMKEWEGKRNKAKNHNLTKVSSKYEKEVHTWFESRKDTKIIFDSNTHLLNFHYADVTEIIDLKKLSNAADVINWYYIQIWIKINRALTSYYGEHEDEEFLGDFPKDSEGSAMVAINGIDRSIAAWNTLRVKLPSEKESIRSMIKMLVWLRMEMEKKFANAMNFEWPPKMD